MPKERRKAKEEWEMKEGRKGGWQGRREWGEREEREKEEKLLTYNILH